MSILLLILGLLLFVGLVVVHEFGHFIMARRNGVTVDEFGIGFPPRIWKKRMKSGFDFTINLLPLGGFVKLHGENDSAKTPGSFGAASLWAKVKIMLAGVVMNLLAAFILMTAVAWIGMPQLICDQFAIRSDTRTISDSRHVRVGSVEPNSPASKIGLQQGDEVLATGNRPENLQPIQAQCPFSDVTKAHAGQSLSIRYMQKGQVYEKTARLLTADEREASQKTNNPKGYLGISVEPSGYAVQRSTWSAPITAAGLLKQVTQLTFQGLGKAVAGLGRTITGLVTHNTVGRKIGQQQATEQVSGPLGIYFLLKAGASQGFGTVLFFISILSLTLAIMNVLPIPALDGGRLFVTLLFRAIKKPLHKHTEELIHGIGFMSLMALFILITIVDVKRFF